jgi:DnaJ domain
VTQDPAVNDARSNRGTVNTAIPLYYSLLDVVPTASPDEIRKAYRQKSKLYHPDTTTLPRDVAVAKFQELNKAYAVLNSAEQRLVYDQQQTRPRSTQSVEFEKRETYTQNIRVKSAYLDAEERPLSPGELFALFILGLTFVLCLVIALVLGISRGEMALKFSQQLAPAPSLSKPSPKTLPKTILKPERSPMLPSTAKVNKSIKPIGTPKIARSPVSQKQG